MINFIVVEDNPLHLEKTKEIIISYMMKNDYPFDIKTFSKFSKELINTIKVGEHNTFIYILDFLEQYVNFFTNKLLLDLF